MKITQLRPIVCILKYLKKRNIKLNTLSFLNGQSQLSIEEVKESQTFCENLELGE